MFSDPLINYYVSDVERSVRFYRDVLGFTETFRTPPDGSPDHVELKLGQFTLGVASIEAARSVHGIVAGAGPPRAELVLWTDDVDQAYASLQARGVPGLSEPHDFLDSLRSAWVADPDGNPIQLVMRTIGFPSPPEGLD